MLRTATRPCLQLHARYISNTSQASSAELNNSPPAELDGPDKQLVEDINISFQKHENSFGQVSDAFKTANAYAENLQDDSSLVNIRPSSEPLKSTQWKRKSAAARFGSDRINQIKLPFELISSMEMLVNESDKHQLRQDAKRLFSTPLGARSRWTADTPKYESTRDERLKGPREGLAYAVITLPGQAAAITSVLYELKLRSPRDWTATTILDFGSQTGAAFWSTLTFFGKREEGWEHQETTLKETSVKRYVGFDNRQGLVSLAKRIERDRMTGDCAVIHRQFWRELNDFDLQQIQGDHRQAIAISAFVLSQLPTSASKKQLVKEMWDSEADTIIIVDQGTPEGFRAVADARDYLLGLGNASEGGAHIVAPCPHDGACPLKSTPDVCAFSQRFHRPEFQKKTKHAKGFYEDVQYSYVVVRRGARPPLPKRLAYYPSMMTSNPIRQDKRSDVPSVDTLEHAPADSSDGIEIVHSEPLNQDDKGIYPDEGDALPLETERQGMERIYQTEAADTVLQEHLRQSSYSWRRIIYSPMKRSGHVTMDTCTPNGQIARIVIPKSQGKRDYYDARKAGWGDLFPHEPKNGEIIRARGIRRLEKNEATSDVEPDEDDSIDQMLDAFGIDLDKLGRSKRDKHDRRDQHRRRKVWRKQEERGYN